MEEGSCWRKWDLHVHTPSSALNNQYRLQPDEREADGGDRWGKYVECLEALTDIAVIGATDYFSVDGYEKLLGFRDQSRLRNLALILPNIELRLDTYVNDKRLNYHVIFSETVPVDAIRTLFLHELHVTTPTGEKYPLTHNTIRQIGRQLKSQQSELKGEDFAVGCEQVTVAPSEVVAVLRNRDLFRRKYLLVLAEAGWSDIDWKGPDHLARKALFAVSHAIFSGNPRTREWALGKTYATPEEYVSEFRSLKPCYHGSDAHDFDRICRPYLNRFCWVKADTTFEGLRQTLFEPEARVAIQDTCPEPHKSIHAIAEYSVRESVITPNLHIIPFTMPLNLNLVAVTGCRGSGKSAFLDLLANCFIYQGGKHLDSNSFVSRIESDAQGLTVEVAFNSEGVEHFTKNLVSRSIAGDKGVTYLPQSAIGRLADQREDIELKIREIILGSEAVIDSSLIDKRDSISRAIVKLAGEMESLSTGIHDLERETAPSEVALLRKRRSEATGLVQDATARLEELTARLGAEQQKDLEKLREEAKVLRSKLVTAESCTDAIVQLIQSTKQYGYALSVALPPIQSTLASLEVPYSLVPPALNAFRESLEASQGCLATLSEGWNARIAEIDKGISELAGFQKEEADLMKEMTRAQEELDQVEAEAKVLEQKHQQLENEQAARLAAYHELAAQYLALREVHEETIARFKQHSRKELEGIDFRPLLDFDTETFVELGTDIVDQRTHKEPDVRGWASTLTKAVFAQHGPDWKPLDKLLLYLSRLSELKKTRDSFDLCRWAFRDYFVLRTQVLLHGIPLDKLSMGQKAIVLLKLYLSEGRGTLLIDQPEEYLDDKSIYDELVDAFRSAKKKRQVIIATNNANLVVNCDAEQIICAKYDGGEITYQPTTIENVSTRDTILEVLEGGAEALLQRENKYQVPDLAGRARRLESSGAP